MAFAYEASEIGKRRFPSAPHSAGEVYIDRGRATLSASSASSSTQLSASDLIGLCRLPKGCVPVDFIAATTNLDSSSAVTFSVGLADASKSSLQSSTSFLTVAAGTIGQGGGVARMNSFNGVQNILARNVDRYVAAKVGTGTTTAVAGYMEGALSYRAAESDEWDSASSLSSVA